MRPASLHLTLAFIGAVTSEQLGILRTVAGVVRAEPFDLCLERLGFEGRGEGIAAEAVVLLLRREPA